MAWTGHEVTQQAYKKAVTSNYQVGPAALAVPGFQNDVIQLSDKGVLS